MALIVLILCCALGFFAWILWGILVGLVFFAAVAIPFGVWEGIMFLTFNNIINLFAKLPSFIGAFFGFALSLPFAAISLTVSVWAYLQTILMGILTFHGKGDVEFCQTFIENYVQPWEDGWPKGFFIVRFYYDHCQWLWGGSAIGVSYFPWQNGCGGGWDAGNFWWPVGEPLPFPMVIIKLFLLALPYMAMFVIPLIPVLWSLTRPLVAAFARLPAVSGNGNGRD